VNGAPAIVSRRDGVIVNILSFVFDGEQIAEIFSMFNPDKLTFVEKQVHASTTLSREDGSGSRDTTDRI
jgi:hypothetical protein